MNTQLLSGLAGFCLPTIMALSALAADPSPSLDPLQGNWAATKTNREGRPYSQLIEVQGNQATSVYEGKLTTAGLSGKVSVKGFEDQFSDSWKASR